MELDRRTCERARLSRDPRFDGRFFICVTTTGIYCRPLCPARTAMSANVRYVASAAAAQAAGFRPCLRCRPESSPGSPAWRGTSTIVVRALRLIDEGALDDAGIAALAQRVGVTSRHLPRLFVRHVGAPPLEVALIRRVHFAKKLIDEPRLPFDEVAYAAGYGSVRRFNAKFRRSFTRTPTQLRRLARQPGDAEAGTYAFRLAYRPPYDWAGAIRYFDAHALAGVVERTLVDQPECAHDDRRRAAPRGAARRRLGPAAQARAKARCLGRRGRGDVAHVRALRRARRADRPAVDAGRGHADEEPAVEPRVARQPRALAGPAIELHLLDATPAARRCWSESDLDRSSRAIRCGGRVRSVRAAQARLLCLGCPAAVPRVCGPVVHV